MELIVTTNPDCEIPELVTAVEVWGKNGPHWGQGQSHGQDLEDWALILPGTNLRFWKLDSKVLKARSIIIQKTPPA